LRSDGSPFPSKNESSLAPQYPSDSVGTAMCRTELPRVIFVTP
jgi:hypothetical protein